MQHILQVWGAGQGVVSLHCFQNVIPVEAYTREACMVEAIGEYISSRGGYRFRIIKKSQPQQKKKKTKLGGVGMKKTTVKVPSDDYWDPRLPF